MIIVNGLNVYPADIEKIINSYPEIVESAVVGKPDKKHGEKITAYITVKNPDLFDKNLLLKFLKNKLAHYKIPDKIIIIENLPKSPIGKILKKDLKNL